jgi:hypothetical protein
VAGLTDLGDPGIADSAMRLFELVEIGDFERELIDSADPSAGEGVHPIRGPYG